MEPDTATVPPPLGTRADTGPGDTERVLDSSVPLIALARDAHGLLIDEFANRHGHHFLVRGNQQSRDDFLELANDSRQGPPPPLFDTWVYRIACETGRVTIGRGAGCDLRVTDNTIAAIHATLDFSGETPTVRDHGSTYGTWVGFDLAEPQTATEVPIDRAISFGLVPLVMVPAPTLVKVLRQVFANV